MNSRPFLADCIKVCDEYCFSSAPAQLGQNPLLVTYGQQRRTLDTATTSVTGQPQQQLQPSATFPQYGPFQQRPQFQQNVIQPLKQTFQTGVTYSFPNQEQPAANNFRELGIDFHGVPQNLDQAITTQPLQPQYQQFPQQAQLSSNLPQQQFQQMPQHMQLQEQFHPMQQQQFQPMHQQVQQFPSHIPPPQMVLTLEQQIALNELQKHALETMLLHEMLKKQSFKLRFHFDGQTDTNDLPYFSCNCRCDLYPVRETKEEDIRNVRGPEAFYSEAVKMKFLQIPSAKPALAKSSDDKQQQNVPDLASVEVQCKRCAEDCRCSSCGCKTPTCHQNVQTDRKVVSFADEPKKILKHPKQSGRSEPTSRSVDDDSDSSSSYDDACDC